MEHQPQILICDDEPAMAQSIHAVLSRGDYRLDMVNDPNQALNQIHTNVPDLVLLDVMMPGMTGFELLDAVDRNRCDSAFIIVTGAASMDSAIRAMRRGASDYVRKPFEPEELIIRVEKVLHQRQLKRAHQCVEAENRNLTKQLQQSQKMEAIGTLAGGIAHDFNNILSIILGNTELALTGMATDNSIRRNLERVLTASLRARETIQQLLSFSRKESAGRKPLELNGIISESLTLLRASLPTNINIEPDICDRPCTAIADATQIHQVMLNLCTNAAHAMEPHGGDLTIRLDSVDLTDADTRSLDGIAAGTFARIEVTDTGHGIKDHIMDRIFDPYFTTKATGKGTGMGLSVVHGIVQASGGTIRVTSRPGTSTSFYLYLPVVEPRAEKQPKDSIQQQLPGGNEHVLIVDDEEMLVDMMQQVLQQLGYTVSAYTDSAAALRAVITRPHAYHLLITDMTMPEMTGLELTQAVQAVRRDLPIIMCTGFNEQVNEETSRALGIRALVMKPVGMQHLSETIRNVLGPSTTERRRHPRFKAPAGAFVISRTYPYQRCRLIDIGVSGLAYSHRCDAKPSNDAASDRLAIMAPDGELLISDIDCRNVSAHPAAGDTSSDRVARTRRGVCFEGLTAIQTDLINQFIRCYQAERIH